MISKEYIINYLVRQTGQLDYYFGLAMKTMDDEAIHQFRVSTKRIRSVSRFIHDITGVNLPSPKIISPLKKLFKPAGALRDYQVQEAIIKKMNEDLSLQLTVIPAYYTKKVSTLKYSFAAHSDNYNDKIRRILPEQAAQNLAAYSDEAIAKLCESWLDNRFNSFIESRHIYMDEKKLHLFRKLFKQAFYVLEILRYNDEEDFYSGEQYEILKKFGQDLGSWHDYFLILENLDNFQKMSHPLRIREESICLREHVKPVYTAILNAILSEIKDAGIFKLKRTGVSH